MSKVVTDTTNLQKIADKIKGYTGSETLVYPDGFESGIDETYEAGKKSQYDLFWDMYQSNGARENYEMAFYRHWNDDTFKPKHDIRPTNAGSMFSFSEITNIRDLDVTIDFSRCTNFRYPFEHSKIKYIGVIDTTSASSLSYFLNNGGEHIRIEKLILKSDGSQSFSNLSFGCARLEHIIFEGCIGKDGFDISSSKKLDKESITSIINCLSSTTTGLTATLSKKAVDKAFETADGFEDGGVAAEWGTLANSKPNWTISLV